MKKKLTVILGMCICFVLSLFLMACMPSNKECVGSGDWVYDAQQHWQICKDEGCYKKLYYADHNYKNNECEVCGFAGVKNLIFNYDSRKQSYIVDGNDGELDSDVVIPATYNDTIHGEHQVTNIKYFGNCDNVLCVSLPNTITTIEEGAFQWCSGLTQINIPNSVRSIGKEAFRGTALAQVTIPESVETIGKSAFLQCANLSSVEMKCEVDKLPDKMFSGCSLLTSVLLPNTLEDMGNSVFSDCSSLETISLPSGITTIGYGAFFGCSSLERVEFSSELKTIGENAFEGCRSLNDISLPSLVKEVKKESFKNCNNLKTVVLGEGVKAIGEDAFEFVPIENVHFGGSISSWVQINGLEYLMKNDCTGAGQIKLYFEDSTEPIGIVDLSDSTIQSIKPYAFNCCRAFTSIKLPRTLKTIGENAFSEGSLQKTVVVHFDGTIDEWANIKGNENLLGCAREARLYVGKNNIIESVELNSLVIEDYAFANITNLENITLPDDIEWVGGNAFKECSNLKFKESNGAYYIGNDTKNLVLIGVKDLNAIECVIDNNCKSIQSGAFKSSKITNIEIGQSVGSIGDSAFESSGLRSLKISGNANLIIGKNVFANCKNLTKVVLQSVKKVGDYAFGGCESAKFYVMSNWDNAVEIDKSKNDCINEDTTYYHSDSRPSMGGKYWHYVDGEPVCW